MQLFMMTFSSPRMDCSHVTTMARAPSTHWTGSWAGHRVYLDTMEKRKILCPSHKFLGCPKDYRAVLGGGGGCFNDIPLSG
jgi:hypothetical protein